MGRCVTGLNLNAVTVSSPAAGIQESSGAAAEKPARQEIT
jgi:hypothetical protein